MMETSDETAEADDGKDERHIQVTSNDAEPNEMEQDSYVDYFLPPAIAPADLKKPPIISTVHNDRTSIEKSEKAFKIHIKMRKQFDK